LGEPAASEGAAPEEGRGRRSGGRTLRDGLDRAWFSAKLRTGLVGPLEIQAYRGYGTADELYLKGRVLELVGLKPPGEKASRRRNLANMGRRFLSSEVPRARVRASALGRTVEVRANGEGYFEARMPPAERPGGGTAWHEVDLELLWPPAGATIVGEKVRARGRVIVPTGAAYGVISDLDDTVIQTGVTSLPTMIRTVLLNDASTRLPLGGVEAFYNALSRGPDGPPTGEPRNPVFYVSNGPWNLYDLLEDFLGLNGLPAGPLFLRDWGPLTLKDRHSKHKLGTIRTLLATYPHLPFVLVGDSGEEDPEVYARVAREHPRRVRAVYIRDVGVGTERTATVRAIARELHRETGVEMILASDSGSAAEHAAKIGLVGPEVPRKVYAASPS
jgi:phosphatidate phosphatase APP1